MTPRHRDLLDFIIAYQRESDGVSPTLQEMAEALNLKSKSGIHRLLSGLEQRGHIQRHSYLARSIKVIAPNDTVSVAELNALVHRLARQEGTERICAALDDLSRSLALQTVAEA